jgi:hypothetical protein
MRELMDMIGREYWITEGPYTLLVSVRDVKQAYGQSRAQVEPVDGQGVAWVSVDRLWGPYVLPAKHAES